MTTPDAGNAYDLFDALLDDLTALHADLGPLGRWSETEDPRGFATWLLMGRLFGLAYAAVHLWRAGFTTEADPIVRLIQEIDVLARSIQDEDDGKDALISWMKDKWIKPSLARTALLGSDPAVHETEFPDSELVADVRHALNEGAIPDEQREQLVRLLRDHDESREAVEAAAQAANAAGLELAETREKFKPVLEGVYNELSAYSHHRRAPIEGLLQDGAFSYRPSAPVPDLDDLRQRDGLLEAALSFCAEWLAAHLNGGAAERSRVVFGRFEELDRLIAG